MNDLLPPGLENVDPDKPLFSIGLISEVLGIHTRTLRIYDEEGILSPNKVSRNKRLYSLHDIEKGKLILYMLRNMGLNIAGIKLAFCLLDELKIPKGKTMEYLNQFLDRLNLTKERQLENIQKIAKKGRPKSIPLPE